MKIFKPMTLLIVITLLLASCHKDTAKPNTSATEYYPNQVGDYWEYDVHDSTTDFPKVKNYTVKVSIPGVKKLADGINASIWQYEYPWGVDTNYVRIVDDTVKVFENAYSSSVEYLQYPGVIYIIPFQDESSWSGKLFGVDTFYVNIQNKVITKITSYDSCYKIYNHYVGPNIENNNNYWFKPNIGFVKKNTNQYNLGPYQITLWELKRYYLK